MEAFADCVCSVNVKVRGCGVNVWHDCKRVQVFCLCNKHDVCVVFLLLQTAWNNCKFMRTKKEKSPLVS